MKKGYSTSLIKPGGKSKPRRVKLIKRSVTFYFTQRKLYEIEFGKEIVNFYYSYFYKPKTPVFIPNPIDNQTETHLFSKLASFNNFTVLLFVFAVLFFLPVNLLPQSKEGKTITGYVENTQGEAWNGQIIELYEDENLLGRDTLENGYFMLENIVTGVEEEEASPTEFTLYQNYPNPFNPTTTIRYSLNKAGKVEIKVYDITGREITELFSGWQNAGVYEAVWDGSDRRGNKVASGVYIYTVRTSWGLAAKKMIYEKHGAGFEWGKYPAKTELRTNNQPLKRNGSGHWVKVYGTEVMTTVIEGLDFSGEGTVDLGTLVAPGRPVLTGFVYDIENKYDDENNRIYPIPGLAGQKVYLGSDSTNYVLTDSNGLFKIIADTTKTDSIYVVNPEGDSAYYNWKRIITLQPDKQTITAFNDTTGIPIFKQWSDSAGIDYFEHLQYVSNVENRFPNTEWEKTMQRFRDEDLPIKIFLNRDDQPNNWYADSAWIAIKKTETGKIKYIETNNIDSSNIQFNWRSPFAGETAFIADAGYDEQGPYLQKKQFIILIRGPPANTELGPNEVKHVVAHELLHTIYALGRHSPYIQDQFNASALARQLAGYPLGPNERERKGIKLIYELERNPKLLDYYK